MTSDRVMITGLNDKELIMTLEKSLAAAWTLDELAKKANEVLSSTESLADGDSRLAQSLTPRNIRRLQSEGAIDKPSKSGREAYYGEAHLTQLLSARSLMSKGFTTNSIQALRAAEAEGALGFLDSVAAPLAAKFSGQSGLGAAVANESPPSGPPRGGLLPSDFDSARLGPARPANLPPNAQASSGPPQIFPEAPVPVQKFAHAGDERASQSERLARMHKEGITKALAQFANAKRASAAELFAGSAPTARAVKVFEAEPIAGLRISVSATPGAEPRPFGPAEAEAAIAAIAACWAAAWGGQQDPSSGS